MKQKCPKCRQEYNFSPAQAGQIFACLECGEDFIIGNTAPAYGNSAGKSKTGLIVAIISVVVAIIFIGVLVFVVGKKSAPKSVVQTKEKVDETLSAIKAGNSLLVAKLLPACDVKKNGWVFLSAAVKGGNRDIIQTVVSAGVDLNQCRNEKGESVLLETVRNNDFETFKFLLKQGADLEKSNGDGDSVWGIAADNGAEKFIEYLVVDQDFVKENSDYEKAVFRALRKGHTECARQLLGKYHVNEQDKAGNSIFMVSCEVNNPVIARISLDKQADISILNERGESAFFIAVKNKNNQLAEMIDSSAVDLKFQSKDGTSLPMICAKTGNHEYLRKLLDENNINLVDNSGKNALYYACERNDGVAVKILLEKKIAINNSVLENSPVYIAVVRNSTDAVRVLCEYKYTFNSSQVDSDGNNLLMLAAATGNSVIFHAFKLDDFDLFKKNNAGKTVFDIASEKNAPFRHRIFEKMDAIQLAEVNKRLAKISSWSAKEQLAEIEKLIEQKKDYPKTSSALRNAKNDINRRLINIATDNVERAIKSAKEDRYYESAIRTLKAAIAQNPQAVNLQEARDYLAKLEQNMAKDKARLEQIKKQKDRIRKMSSDELKNEITGFINSWLQDMQMDRYIGKYYDAGCSTRFFNVKSWQMLGPIDDSWSHFYERIIVAVESTQKGGTPIRVNWKISLSRNDDMQWKIIDVSE